MSPQTTSHRTQPPLILGSTSVYRAELLRRLQLPFTTVQPNVDETPLSGETPLLLAKRLALAKANAVADRHPDAVVIGSKIIQIAEQASKQEVGPAVGAFLKDIRNALDTLPPL